MCVTLVAFLPLKNGVKVGGGGRKGKIGWNRLCTNLKLIFAGSKPEDGVPDMTVISNIDERGINRNLRERYNRDSIYVSINVIWFPAREKVSFIACPTKLIKPAGWII